MTNCCNICVDPNCGGKKNCNCETCSKRDTCYRYAGLKPTIRITRKCTQACSHCCFECSPSEKEMMTIEKSLEISKFCRINNITRCQVMGGEFFVHPQWETILDNLTMGMKMVRIVSNGDWAGNEAMSNRVVDFMKSHPQCSMGVSKDQWHTNTHVDKAINYLTLSGIRHRTPEKEEIDENTIVPVGRSEYDMSFYGMLACYCRNNEKRYHFLIDENGEIYKCGFGSWRYANTEDYLEGGFDKRFQEFNNKFYGAWISSCTSCKRSEEHCRNKDK